MPSLPSAQAAQMVDLAFDVNEILFSKTVLIVLPGFIADLAFDRNKMLFSIAVRQGSIPAGVKSTDHCARPGKFKEWELAKGWGLFH
jgi:hypothetical protein